MLREIFSNRRLITYIGINIVISALTALLVIWAWTQFALNSTPASLSGNPVAVGAFSGQLSISALIGAGDIENERVTITHIGDEDVSLLGWILRGNGSLEYRFPALVLHPGGEVAVYTRTGDDGAAQLFWDRQIPAWESGEIVNLYDPSGTLQATYSLP